MTKPVYMDYQSTTPVDPRVIEDMTEVLKNDFGNPHSRSHYYGWRSEELVEISRKQVADLIGAHDKEVFFTSGATESNNIAIKGIAQFYKSSGKNHIITVATEHKCVINSCRDLEDDGFKVTFLSVKKNGLIDLDDLKNSITEKTSLVSVMAVNNEIGVIQPIAEIGKICREKGVFFHTDAAQAFGKMKINVNENNIDAMSISGHKIYGPKGVGALYVRRKPRVRIKSPISGGGQERGIRSGTVPTSLAVGLGRAAQIANDEMQQENQKISKLSQLFYDGIMELPKVYLNGDKEKRIPGNLNFSFAGVEGESLLMAIKDLAVSSGSACTSASLEPSYVLHSIGVDVDMAHSSIRFGIGRFTTEEEIKFATNLIKEKVIKLRELSPIWEMIEDGINLKTIEWTGH
jgi:cysteine desulfurase